jgi:hypothetical protein
MYSFAKFLADHLLLQNREKNIKKISRYCARSFQAASRWFWAGNV